MKCVQRRSLHDVPYVLAGFLVLLSAGVSAQTAIPESGSWTLDGKTVVFFKTYRDEEPISARVNACGDRVHIIHPALIGGALILEFDGKSYIGSGKFNSPDGKTGDVAFDLNTVSAKILKGSVKIDAAQAFTAEELAGLQSLPPGIREVVKREMNNAVKQNWIATLRFDENASPENYGEGEVRNVGTSNSAQGLIREETTEYRVILADFNPNASTLLALHLLSLDQARAIMNTKPSGKECAVNDFLGPIQGFGDFQGLEKETWETMAGERAHNTGLYFLDAKDENGSPLVPGMPPTTLGNHAKGVGRDNVGACMRAAVADFKVVKRWTKPYTKAETADWLRDWMGQACPKWGQSKEKCGLRTGNTDAARTAKFSYCVANSFLEMMEKGYCEPPVGSPAERVLLGDRIKKGEFVWNGAKDAFEKLYKFGREIQEGRDETMAEAGGVGDTEIGAQEADLDALKQNVYERYARGIHGAQPADPSKWGCPDDVKQAADSIELTYFERNTGWDPDKTWSWTLPGFEE